MRLPLLLALAVILLTPANIREIAMDMAGKAQTVVASIMQDRTVASTLEVADSSGVAERRDGSAIGPFSAR
jgi:hypothetical protein